MGGKKKRINGFYKNKGFASPKVHVMGGIHKIQKKYNGIVR